MVVVRPPLTPIRKGIPQNQRNEFLVYLKPNLIISRPSSRGTAQGATRGTAGRTRGDANAKRSFVCRFVRPFVRSSDDLHETKQKSQNGNPRGACVRSSVIPSVRSFVRRTVYKKQMKNFRMGNHCSDRGDNLLRTRPRSQNERCPPRHCVSE